MSMDDPPIFNITVRMKRYYDTLISSTMDCQDAYELNEKLLKYILRCQMSDYLLYRKASLNFNITPDVEKARKNFARLFKQCDVCEVLPIPALGIIRSTYPLNLFPITPSQRSIVMQTGQQQTTLIENFVQQNAINFVIYISNYGITPAISLPTISIILDDLSNESSMHIINRLHILYAFDLSSFIVRFAQGYVMPCGRIWHYERVPIGASISPDESYIVPSISGTLGCYCTSADSDDIYALTAGHVARPVPAEATIEMYAPAQKPFDETLKSIRVARNYYMSKGKDLDAAAHDDMLTRLSTLSRSFGKVVCCSTKTDDIPPYYKIDYALLKIDKSRNADNDLSKLAVLDEEYSYTSEGKVLRDSTDPVHVGDTLIKLGIRTGLTSGTAIDEVKVRWHPVTTTTLTEAEAREIGGIPVSNGHAILGNAQEDGTFEDFALPGDSGSVIIRLHQDLKEAPVTKSEAVGILYGIVYEEPKDYSVSLYIPMMEIYQRIREEIGLSVSVDGVPEQGDGGQWPYTELGKGSFIA